MEILAYIVVPAFQLGKVGMDSADMPMKLKYSGLIYINSLTNAPYKLNLSGNYIVKGSVVQRAKGKNAGAELTREIEFNENFSKEIEYTVR